MYPIPMPTEITPEFAECWIAAGRHLNHQIKLQVPDFSSGGAGWLKADLIPPRLEDLSFRLGNQLFFVRVIDESDGLGSPVGDSGLTYIADNCKGHACVMPMRRSP